MHRRQSYWPSHSTNRRAIQCFACLANSKPQTSRIRCRFAFQKRKSKLFTYFYLLFPLERTCVNSFLFTDFCSCRFSALLFPDDRWRGARQIGTRQHTLTGSFFSSDLHTEILQNCRSHSGLRLLHMKYPDRFWQWKKYPDCFSSFPLSDQDTFAVFRLEWPIHLWQHHGTVPRCEFHPSQTPISFDPAVV